MGRPRKGPHAVRHTFFAILFLITAIIIDPSLAEARNTQPTGTAFTLNGRVGRVQDGDSLTLTAHNGAHFPIRLADIDAPEITHEQKSRKEKPVPIRPGQNHGPAAHQSLRQLAPEGMPARAQCYEKDTYGRLICHVWVNDLNINHEQLRRGWAMLPLKKKWIHDHTSESVQKEARLAKRGVWSERAPIHPYEWRRRCWRNGDCPGAQP